MQAVLAPGATRAKVGLNQHTDGVQEAERLPHVMPPPCRLDRHRCPLPADLQGPLDFVSDAALCDGRQLWRCGGSGRRDLRRRAPRGGLRWYSLPRGCRQRRPVGTSWLNAPLRDCALLPCPVRLSADQVVGECRRSELRRI